MNANVYLGAFLAPLSPWLGRPEVTDVLVNAPGEVWVETATEGMRREAAPGLDETTLQRLVRQIAAYSSQGVNREQPLLSATLPDGARVQVVAPPATRGGTVLAVRKHLISDLSLEDLSASGLFVRPAGEDAGVSGDGIMASLLEAGDRLGFLREAVRRRKTIVISGGTGSGKTTLLNALVKEIDESERLVVIEDAPEIRLDHPNSVGLIAVRGDMGEARVDADALLIAALRLRPDRILLGELRGSEAFAFLRAVNSGHPGSITTIHADSPAGALDQIGLLALTSGLELGWDKVQAYVSRVIDVVVQIERSGGVRRISDIQFLGRRA
ncbi:MAG: P-type DNA transfer ATPase VirB11 [Phenylobacterium sp.]|jgi:type IV secretion system protein VirB11|uniref:P-type DNA transfer ATPase VirB11 n=1 Tax=Phenylobacterium sp. TaxID=1871053 RepID=UPI0025E18ED2|nr:P-type DNA transfer ATPase VirB11 [Phenylobacterium sp.]MCA6298554.1 P-type DNA transfer ATPase VirB11 [Phenylobacterium sp.]